MSFAAVARRAFSTSRARLSDTVAVPVRRPIGGVRGGIIGFLAGFSVAAGFSAYQLLEEYKLASAALQTSIEQLQANTEKVSAHIGRIEKVESELKTLASTASTKEETSKLRAELKKAHDTLHLEALDLKAHVWGIQQDLHAFSKSGNSSSRT
ncbi:hypothetical protein BKA62DRAFT_692678 [Auriculariales sp. MPI-PUGE-AT-0066]|nr:hypothetical protein BKA62DRAFT_692678 [Auriculariales sp. MPI-PUGE-AT-0066]